LLPYMLDRAWNAGQIAAGLLLLIAQGTSLILFFQRRESGVIVMAAGNLVFVTCLFGAMLPHLQPLWVSSQIVQTVAILKPCADSPRIASTYNEPSLVFLAGTATQLRTDGASVAGDLQRDPCSVGVVEDNQRDSFLRSFAQDAHPPQPVAIIDGFIVPRGRRSKMTLYLMPRGSGGAP